MKLAVLFSLASGALLEVIMGNLHGHDLRLFRQLWDALQRAYGPRKIGILRSRSDIYALKGDKEAARKTMEEALRYAESLPSEQRSEALLTSIRKKLATM